MYLSKYKQGKKERKIDNITDVVNDMRNDENSTEVLKFKIVLFKRIFINNTKKIQNKSSGYMKINQIYFDEIRNS